MDLLLHAITIAIRYLYNSARVIEGNSQNLRGFRQRNLQRMINFKVIVDLFERKDLIILES